MRFAACCLMLFAFAGNTMAQNDPQCVIKKGDHYLAHVLVGSSYELQDVSGFNPTTCLWYTGNTVDVTGDHHNYYFHDGNNFRFLSAPLQAGGTLSLSASLPSISLLRNTDQIYYFYDWDWDSYGAGVSRGHKHVGVTQQGDCDFSWGDNQCWEVYWVELNNGIWKLSETTSYNITPNSARFREVTSTEHPMVVTNEQGGMDDLTLVDYEMEFGESGSSQNLSVSVNVSTTNPFTCDYIPAYTHYVFEGVSHFYYNNEDHTNAPGSTHGTASSVVSYLWTISGVGASYLTFDEGDEHITSSSSEAPTLYYYTPNTEGDQTAIVTVAVTYNNGVTQTRSASLTVKAKCGNPGDVHATVTYEGVTLSWNPTADQYKVYWTSNFPSDPDDPIVYDNSVELGDVTSYTFSGLLQSTTYYYKVAAICGGTEMPDATSYSFTTKGEPGLLVYGAIFGGGRMANVGKDTEVVIVNCDSISAVYGGNDIAGSVLGNNGADGSKITIGVNEGDPDALYGITNGKIRIGSVYGGGNGYYAYNGTSFVAASYNTRYFIENGASVRAMTQSHQVGDVVWTNTTGSVRELVCPTIPKANIKVTNDYVKVDSLFGGAKNAILNATSDDVTITINGGTLYSVFGGNNFGGSLGNKSQEHIVVNSTTTRTGFDYSMDQLGRDFGIGYLFGGGNKVEGQNIDITVNGGQIDTIFGGGNKADVRSTIVTINCQLGAFDENSGAYGKVYSDAISAYQGGTLTIDNNYSWDRLGIYNVRTLFGGNNRAPMAGVPTLVLTSGSIGTAYGGGNMGDMLAQATDNGSGGALQFNGKNVKYSTHVKMDSPNILIDYLYGGCQKSNVDYSTWTEIKNGHVGTVYGGCNISGDVGSTRVNVSAESGEDYQEVQGGTFVKATGGIVYKNLFGGSNGFYHCNNGVFYVEGIQYDMGNYVGMRIPTHNETQVVISAENEAGVEIKGNVYAGGNMSPVGFIPASIGGRPYPSFVGWASVIMDGGTVQGDVYGGGNMASIYGSNEAKISGGTINGAVYGGNDRSGQAGQISNRILPVTYNKASDGYTPLTDIHTFVGITGTPEINTVYGGGNGDYVYDGPNADMEYCLPAGSEIFQDKPIQNRTFVDININGAATNGGHINTVYGGGNGVTVQGSITVFLNVVEASYTRNHVDTIFGGNNKDNVVENENAPLVPDIILLRGQVGTVYGGCNRGAMTTGKDFVINGNTYRNVGSMVRLRSTYPSVDGPLPAVVSQAVYGGCRMNDVTYNSLVLVEGGIHGTATLFGGCDISGAVGDTARVVVTSGITGTIFGGGNGNYTYGEGTNAGNVYLGADLIATGVTNNPPTCSVSRVDLLGGQVGTDATHTADVFGGGYGQPTNTTGNVFVNIGPATATSWTGLPVIFGDIYGGSALGTVNTDASNTTKVSFMNGTLHGSLYGGGLGDSEALGTGHSNVAAKVNGKVFVNISNENQTEAQCFIDLRDATVYGCNNVYGSPQDDVMVDVWKTAYNFVDYQTGDKYKASFSGDDASYAIGQVFGGGHKANYAPEDGDASSSKRTKVYVHGCQNTIQRVFSGGDAAAAIGVLNTIQGGRMDYVFGGGNGELGEAYAANIGAGGTNLVVNGGTITHLFGGSNKFGNIAGTIYTEVNGDNEGCPENITEFFGGCNEAPLTTESGIYSIINCGTGTIGEVYGGSKLADIKGNVTLDVEGGNITTVFGGSKGVEGDGGAADIDGSVTLNLYGGTIDQAYGGTNNNGNITGLIKVNVIEADGSCGLGINDVYGGGRRAAYTPTFTYSGTERIAPEVNIIHGTVNNVVYGGGWAAPVASASPKVTIGDDDTDHKAIVGAMLNDNSGQGYGIVFGGGDVAHVGGNTLVVYDDNHPDSHVNFIFGGGNQAGVGGNIVVNMNNGHLIDTIFGGCNVSGEVSGTITVTVNGGTTGSVVGGGNLADYSAPDGNDNYPYVRVTNGTVTGMVVGGGNRANITGNPRVSIEGGLIGTTGEGAGVYGGCNKSGTVTGNTNVVLTGGTVGTVVNEAYTGHIHGGGYGKSTNVTGNVLVNFGADDDTEALEFPKLFGDLYGGSALGNVNTNANNTTRINLRNGTINGAVYGGGLGDKVGLGTGHENVEAKVYGVVYINVGNATDPDYESTYTGQATLSNCDIYGCNNLNGSPQDNVYLNVYKTAHVDENVADYTENDATYAIDEVFGGGNQADFTPTGKKTYVHIHKCENTIRRLFGGGNAAYVPGIDLTIDGGRLHWVFGGGNGELGAAYAANIGAGGITIHLGGGRIDLLVNGSNEHGDVLEGGSVTLESFDGCENSVVIDHFMGANQTTIYGNITETIECGTDKRFVNLYCGSNLAQIYGNISLIIEGGVFENVFGGSKGSLNNTANPEGFQTYASSIHDNPNTPELEGHVNLLIKGGTIGNIFGACDENGNVDGKITITVDRDETSACDPLFFIGNIYGGGNQTDYTPLNINNGSGSAYSPEIIILKGVIGGTSPTDSQSHPLLPVLNPSYVYPAAQYEGNVFGGGNEGNVGGEYQGAIRTSNPKIVIGEKTNTNKVTIEGDVFGGGNKGNVLGSPEVIIVPAE